LFALLGQIDNAKLRFDIIAAFSEFFDVATAIGQFSPPLEYANRAFVTEKQRNRGKRSGEARKQKAEMTWESIALAKESRKVDRGMAQDDVADFISHRWKAETKKRGQNKIKCPVHSTLKGGISRWIRTGKLPDKIRQ
jgi:hypothetical protein